MVDFVKSLRWNESSEKCPNPKDKFNTFAAQSNSKLIFMLKVFKFGGGSIRNPEAVQKLFRILNVYAGEPLIVVISAFGKTTNALEAMLFAIRNNDADQYNVLFERLKSYHMRFFDELFIEDDSNVRNTLNTLFSDLDENMKQFAKHAYDFHYDQTISFGELFSTTVVSAYLNEKGLPNTLLDAREFIITDNHYRNANVDWDLSCARMSKMVLSSSDMYITQGFISSASEGSTTTLGREGSDYTAAIFAYCTNAAEVVIWKDVAGLLNADPKRFGQTVQLENISYAEAIELAFYGATIIHPKTIKPLQNKSIPLKVQSFETPDSKPSLISNNTNDDSTVPSYIMKDDQMLLSISPRDFSFMNESNLHKIFGMLSRIDIQANLIQTSAISLSLCADYDSNKLEVLFGDIKDDYSLKYNSGLQLLTIRHYNDLHVEQLLHGKSVLLEQRSRVTAQFVIKQKPHN
jgi:aspartate kinase